MKGNYLLLLIMTGVYRCYTEDHCGVCLCIYLENGCVQADCSGRNISSVPTQVPNQTCILTVRNNGIQSLQDYNFQRLVNLTHLDLSANQIQNMSKNCFIGLKQLNEMNLSENNLDFSLDNVSPEVFKPLVNLKHLKIKMNPYNDYPDTHLRWLESLEVLTLDGLQNRSFGPGFDHLKNLTSLSLSGSLALRCKLSSLFNSTFNNVDALKSLNLSFCDIRFVEQGTISSLQNIEVLDLSYNEHLLFTGVRNVTKDLQNSNIRHLAVNKIVPEFSVCVVIGKSFVEYLQNTSLEVIEVSENRIDLIEVEALQMLPKSLQIISAGNSRFTTGPYLRHLYLLRNLTSLDLSGRRESYDLLHDFQDESFDVHIPLVETDGSCSLNRMTNIHEIREKDLVSKWNRVKYTKSFLHSFWKYNKDKVFRVPPNLKVFRYSFSELYYFLSNIYLAENSLEYVDLSMNVFSHWPGPVVGVEKVKYLDLSYNFAEYVDYRFFENFKSLQYLNVSRNHLSKSIYHDDHGTLFRRLNNLIELDLSGNDLVKLPYRFLEGLSSLQILNISRNYGIYNLELNYTSNTKLRFIDSSFNDIGFISKNVRDTLDHLAQTNNFSIDLSMNPFVCSCDPKHLSFLDWLFNTKAQRSKSLMCIHQQDKSWQPLEKIYRQLKKSCKSHKSMMIGISATLMGTGVIICCILYRYRWRLIYLYYVMKRKLKRGNKNYETIYDFDAFVSYADKDIDFVTTLMLSRLELDQGLNFYIRDRDSMPGTTIAENIIDGIQRSRKSILLISKASLVRKWCRYELQMANMEEISTKRNVMILVMLESVPSKDIPSEILYFVQNNCMLQYPAEDPSHVNIFWATLTEALRS